MERGALPFGQERPAFRAVQPSESSSSELSSCGTLPKAESQGFLSLPALNDFAGDKTLSELIKVNHD